VKHCRFLTEGEKLKLKIVINKTAPGSGKHMPQEAQGTSTTKEDAERLTKMYEYQLIHEILNVFECTP
jgi:hypothetical protein